MEAHSIALNEIMTANPVRVRADERLDIALALMTACHFRHLPVTEGDTVIGMVSFRDLQRASRSSLSTDRAERARHLRQLEVRTLMSRPALTAAPEESVL